MHSISYMHILAYHHILWLILFHLFHFEILLSYTFLEFNILLFLFEKKKNESVLSSLITLASYS